MNGVIVTGCHCDPSNANAYDAGVPNVPSRFVSCAGSIQGVFETAMDGNDFKAFAMKVQDYVHGTKWWSTLEMEAVREETRGSRHDYAVRKTYSLLVLMLIIPFRSSVPLDDWLQPAQRSSLILRRLFPYHIYQYPVEDLMPWVCIA
ncbi:hypothetical protein EIP86_005231 [Pleurotus ostreatoroseus]|nr:hypothetical protein EIP86_005231 [Pleurotus ostreatoroseus]